MSIVGKRTILILSDGETWEEISSDMRIAIVEWDDTISSGYDDCPIDEITSAAKWGEEEGIIIVDNVISGEQLVEFVNSKLYEI